MIGKVGWRRLSSEAKRGTCMGRMRAQRCLLAFPSIFCESNTFARAVHLHRSCCTCLLVTAMVVAEKAA